VSRIEDNVCKLIQSSCYGEKLISEITGEVQDRAKLGESKYGVTLERDDYSTAEWCTHLKEELLDTLCYATRIQEIKPELDINLSKLKYVAIQFVMELQQQINKQQ
jgi:hypothetical protein